jgi:AbiV family abortive infection protein
MLDTLDFVDSNAIQRADRRALVSYAAAVAANARGLLDDAELLLGAARWARAYSLAVLAAEEWAKAYSVLTLSFMAPEMRAQIPVRDFLEGHQMKMVGALLLLIVDGARPGVASRVATMPLADVLRTAVTQASTANAAKQRGLYADLMADGTLSLPSDVAESDAREAVVQAREVGSSAALLHDQEALARFADPSAESLAVAEAVFGRLSEAKGMDDADAAGALLSDMAARLAVGETHSDP